MTTRRGESPNLDRRLTREVTVETEAPATMAFAYAAPYTPGGDNLDDGTWRRDSDTELGIAFEDSNGANFPQDLVTPLPV